MSSRGLTLSSGKPFNRSASASLSCNLPLSAEHASYFCCGMLITHQNRFSKENFMVQGQGFMLQSSSGCWIASSCGGTGWMFLSSSCWGTAGRIVAGLTACFIVGGSRQQQLVAKTLFFGSPRRKSANPPQVPGEPGRWQLYRACHALHGSSWVLRTT